MVIDLLPRYLAAVSSADVVEGYRRFFDDNRDVLAAFWLNHVSDPDGPHAEELMRQAARAPLEDLEQLVRSANIPEIAQDTLGRCEELFHPEQPVDVYLLAGVGDTIAGELVVDGRGIAFVCVQHFTGRPDPETGALGLPPTRLPLWIAHTVAHAVRYTSPDSHSEIARLVADAGGYYDSWDAGSQATVAELLINEGLAVLAAEEVVPGHDAHEYLGYSRNHYRRIRQLESFLQRVVEVDLPQSGLGFRLRYLSRNAPASARRSGDRVIPERTGYYLGRRLAERHARHRGIASALRTSATECLFEDTARLA